MKRIAIYLALPLVALAADAIVFTGQMTVTGQVQMISGSFSAPAKAVPVSPVDTGTHVELAGPITWANGGGAASYKFYLDQSATPITPTTLVQNSTSTSYVPSLTYSLKYYARIDAVNSAGTTTGDIYSFTAVTPIAATTFTSFEDGSSGADLTITNLNNSTFGSIGTWAFVGGTNIGIKIQTDASSPAFYTPFDVGGTPYTGTGTQGISCSNAVNGNAIIRTLTSPSNNLALSGFVKYEDNTYSPGARRGLDSITINGANDGSPHYAILQQANNGNVILHADNLGTSPGISITLNKWYFFTLVYVKNGNAIGALWDPLNNFAQVGATQTLPIGNTQAISYSLGPADAHVGAPATFTRFDNVVASTGSTFLGP